MRSTIENVRTVKESSSEEEGKEGKQNWKISTKANQKFATEIFKKENKPN